MNSTKVTRPAHSAKNSWDFVAIQMGLHVRPAPWGPCCRNVRGTGDGSESSSGAGSSLLTAGGGASYWHIFAGLTVAVSFVLGLEILERSIDRQQRLDRYLLDAFLEHIPDNVFFKDLDSRFVRISSAMAKYCGLKNPAQAVRKTDADLFSREHAEQALADEREMIRTGRPIIGKEERETWPDGHETWVLTTKVPLRDRDGRITGTMGISRDITDRKQAELRVQHAALHDTLTGLPNRMLLEDRLNQAIISAKRDRNSVAVLVVDLNHSAV